MYTLCELCEREKHPVKHMSLKCSYILEWFFWPGQHKSPAKTFIYQSWLYCNIIIMDQSTQANTIR